MATGKAAAAALRTGYAPLYVRNEYMHKLNDEQLRGLIVEETGAKIRIVTARNALARISFDLLLCEWGSCESVICRLFAASNHEFDWISRIKWGKF
jgi:hypothetical protein